MAKYSTFKYGEDIYSGTGSFSSPLTERVPWIFQALDSGDSYEFAINPIDATIPSIKKNITTQNTAAGSILYFQGRNTVPSMKFSGTILTEEHYNAMKVWSAVDKQIAVTDDLGRTYWVYIKDFSPTRKYTPDFPWRHEFNVEAVLLNWA